MSFDSTSIQSSLKFILKKYEEYSIQKDPSDETNLGMMLCSKMAIMELSGWIEETIDSILVSYLDKNMTDSPQDLKNCIINECIKTVYGFGYKNDYRPLMEKVLGAIRFKQIVEELNKNGGQNEILKAEFGDLHNARRRAAHTQSVLHDETKIFDAPSKTWDRFNKILPIMQNIETLVLK